MTGNLTRTISILMADPLREEALAVLNSLRKLSVFKTVMMTGDNEKTAAVIAAQAGVDEYYAEVLPEDKARFAEAERAAGRTVIMIDDSTIGFNFTLLHNASTLSISLRNMTDLLA